MSFTMTFTESTYRLVEPALRICTAMEAHGRVRLMHAGCTRLENHCAWRAGCMVCDTPAGMAARPVGLHYCNQCATVCQHAAALLLLSQGAGCAGCPTRRQALTLTVPYMVQASHPLPRQADTDADVALGQPAVEVKTLCGVRTADVHAAASEVP